LKVEFGLLLNNEINLHLRCWLQLFSSYHADINARLTNCQQDWFLIQNRLPTNACIWIHVVTSGHMTKMAVTTFYTPYPKKTHATH